VAISAPPDPRGDCFVAPTGRGFSQRQGRTVIASPDCIGTRRSRRGRLPRFARKDKEELSSRGPTTPTSLRVPIVSGRGNPGRGDCRASLAKTRKNCHRESRRSRDVAISLTWAHRGCRASLAKTRRNCHREARWSRAVAISQHTIWFWSSAPAVSLLSCLYTGGQSPASVFLAPNLASRYGFIRVAESHHTSYGFGQEGRGTMLCTRVGSIELPKHRTVSPCPPDAMTLPPYLRLQPVSVPVLHPGNRSDF